MSTIIAYPAFGVHAIDRFIDAQIAHVDAELRGHCQEVDCGELADVSEMRTSLSHCYRHHWERRDALAYMLRRQSHGDL